MNLKKALVSREMGKLLFMCRIGAIVFYRDITDDSKGLYAIMFNDMEPTDLGGYTKLKDVDGVNTISDLRVLAV